MKNNLLYYRALARLNPITPYLISLFLLYIIAIIIRFYGIWIPRASWDEWQHLTGARNMLKFVYGLLICDMSTANPHSVVTIYGVFGKYICMVSLSIGKFVEYFLTDISPETICRILNRVFVSFLPSIITIFFTHKTIKLFNGSRVYIIFMLVLYCFVFKHIETAHYAVPDSLSTMLSVLCIYFLVKFQLRGHVNRFLIYSTLVASCAAATKINVGGILCGTIALVVIFEFLTGKMSFKQFLFFSIVSFLTFIISSLIINIPYLIEYNKWINTLLLSLKHYSYDYHGAFQTYLYFSPVFGVGTGVFILSVLGIGTIPFLQKKEKFIAPLAFLITFTIFLVTSKGAEVRWAIPMTPFFILFSALFLEQIYKLAAKKNVICAIIIAVLILSATGFNSFYQAIQFNLNLTEKPQTIDLMRAYFANEADGLECIRYGERTDGIKCSKLLNIEFNEFIDSDFTYAVYSPLWCERSNVPDSLRYQNGTCYRKAVKVKSIFHHIRSEWQLVKIIEPKYYSNWSKSIASQQPYYIYRRNIPDY